MIQAVTDAGQLADAIGRVVRSGKGYATNLFASPAEKASWIASRTLSLLQEEQAMLVVRRDTGFHRLYHVASDAASLSAALQALCAAMPEATLVADLVGKRGSTGAVVDAYLGHAFVRHERLQRMYRLAEHPSAHDGRIDAEVVQAGPADVRRIHALMQRQLDPFSEQVPDLDELRDAVAKRSVLVVSRDSELAGVLVYDTVGFTSTLRHWHVDPRFRNQGVGARLIRAFFDLCRDSQRILLWVIAGNDDAIAKYRHYGFRDDSLVDDIMLRQPRLVQ